MKNIMYKINKVYPVRSQSSKMTVSSNGGITLIEIIVVIGILTVIIAFGMIVDFSSFTSDTLQAEESKIVSILEKARSRAMSNMFDSAYGYGVCYNASNYVIFRDRATCLPLDPSKDEPIPANVNIATASDFVNPLKFPTIFFDKLTGDVAGATITISVTDGIKSQDIEINEEGTINW